MVRGYAEDTEPQTRRGEQTQEYARGTNLVPERRRASHGILSCFLPDLLKRWVIRRGSKQNLRVEGNRWLVV